MRKILLIALLAFAGARAHASIFGLDAYAGAGLMRTSVNRLYGTDFHIHDVSWKALAGVRLTLLGAELDYYHLGSDSGSFDGLGSVSARARAVAAYVVGYLPLPLPVIDVYGKLGLDRWQLSGDSARASLFRASRRGTQLAWGVGAQAHFGHLAGRLEYERLNIASTGGAHIVSLSVVFDFL